MLMGKNVLTKKKTKKKTKGLGGLEENRKPIVELNESVESTKALFQKVSSQKVFAALPLECEIGTQSSDFWSV